MAEIQKNTNLGEMTQRFIEFVMMQSQHAALFLGQIANPQTGQASVNLEAAKMFIDQLAMVREKTRGNLSKEESKIIENALANLQLTYIEISGDMTAYEISEPEKDEPAVTPQKVESPAITNTISTDTNVATDSKKRFTKSYGA